MKKTRDEKLLDHALALGNVEAQEAGTMFDEFWAGSPQLPPRLVRRSRVRIQVRREGDSERIHTDNFDCPTQMHGAAYLDARSKIGKAAFHRCPNPTQMHGASFPYSQS